MLAAALLPLLWPLTAAQADQGNLRRHVLGVDVVHDQGDLHHHVLGVGRVHLAILLVMMIVMSCNPEIDYRESQWPLVNKSSLCP